MEERITGGGLEGDGELEERMPGGGLEGGGQGADIEPPALRLVDHLHGPQTAEEDLAAIPSIHHQALHPQGASVGASHTYTFTR